MSRKSRKIVHRATNWKRYRMDADTLECPICSESFSPPVFQCENGHSICSACCNKIKVCPSCSEPIGRIRCLAIEKVIESLEVQCENTRYGCREMVKYSKRFEHENKVCQYQPFECPLQLKYGWRNGCTYKGRRSEWFSIHLEADHDVQIVECTEPTRSASFEVKALDDFVLFKAKEAWLLLSWIINDDDKGRKFYCYSLEASKEVEYKLTIKPVSLDGESKKLVYSIQNVLSCDLSRVGRDGEEFDYLVVPGKETTFEITLSLV